MALSLAGCGQLVSEKLAASSSDSAQPCTGKKMVILPFADYSYEEDAARALQRNVMIMENLTARLTEKGFRLPVQEDLLKYLADNNIIKFKSVADSAPAMPGYIQDTIANDSSWSPTMKMELAKLNEQSNKQQDTGNPGQGIALDQNTLSNIAGNFNADLVMRGQIIRYELGDENTWNPMKRGLLPVVFGGTNRAIFGVTNSEAYDTLGYALLGAAMGGAIGTTTSIPYDETEKLNPDRHNAMVWGLGGAAIGYMASKGGHANQAAVQLRLWVQNPESGEVVWTNSARVLVKPQTIFAETREDKLFDTAITQAVAALMNDFAEASKTVL
jgi:hypothetical protein